MRAIDRAEALARATAAIPVFAATAMAVLGLRHARRQPRGRGVGTPYREIPLAFFLIVGSAYAALSVRAWRPLPLRFSGQVRWLATAAGLSLYGTGMGFVFAGRLALGNMYNLSATTGAELYVDQRLVTSGPFQVVRHPMYFGAVLAGIGALLLYRTWTLLVICLHLPVLFVRARREEEVLEQEFGDEWRAYRANVPAGVPGLRRGSSASGSGIPSRQAGGHEEEIAP